MNNFASERTDEKVAFSKEDIPNRNKELVG